MKPSQHPSSEFVSILLSNNITEPLQRNTSVPDFTIMTRPRAILEANDPLADLIQLQEIDPQVNRRSNPTQPQVVLRAPQHQTMPTNGQVTSRVDDDSDDDSHIFQSHVSVRVRGPASVEKKKRYGIKRFFRYFGPGFMMSVAYMDPGDIGASITSRSIALYAHLWTLVLRTFLGFLLQSRAINLGVATGHNLAQHCRVGYPKPVRVILWLMTELALLFGDWQEVLGTSIALHVISHEKLPLWAGTPITIAVTFLLLQLERLGIRRLEALFYSCIAIMFVLFCIQYSVAAPPQGEVLKGIFAPLIPSGTLDHALATISSAVVPHNAYLHSTLVLSRRINRQNESHVKESIWYNTIETAVALIISIIVNIFVVSIFAKMDYSTCGPREDVLLINVAPCLVTNYGSWILYVWAIALYASGQSSTCHGAYTGSFVLSGLMNINVSCICRTLIVRGISIGPAIAMAIYATDVKSAKLIQGWLNVIQALQLPLVLIPLLTFTMSRKTMGKFVNSIPMSVVCILASFLLVALNFYFAFPFIAQSLPDNGYMHAVLGALFVIYMGFLVHLFLLCFGGIARVYYYLTTGQKYNPSELPSSNNDGPRLDGVFIPAPLPIDEETINARANMMDPVTGNMLNTFDLPQGLPEHLIVSPEDAMEFKNFWLS